MWPFPHVRQDWEGETALPTDAPSYHVWWNTLGRYLGAPYDPPASQDSALNPAYDPTPPPPAPVHVIEEPNGVALFMPALDSPQHHRMHEIGDAILGGRTAVSGYFYDADLAKFGNAVSPFVEMSAKDAHLAEQRRFEDRYDPKYFDYDEGMNPEAIAFEIALRCEPLAPPRPMPQGTYVGWSPPPHPVDVVVSFNPSASARDRARAVLYDYYHDDALRDWSDNEAVKRCFIATDDPRKEDHDPLLLVQAYENKKHKVWSCKGDKNTWKDMDDAVQKAIAHRTKLGPLPTSTYDSEPVVIYYYDNDKMKRVSYPKLSIADALNTNDSTWWAWGKGPQGDDAKDLGVDDIHIVETDDPKKIAKERAQPGWTKGAKDKKGSAGEWSDEGFAYDKDWAGRGIWASLVGAILAVVDAVLSAMSFGAAAAILTPLIPVITAAVSAADSALHAGDFGAALNGIGTALIQLAAASSKSTLNIPPEAVKALGATVMSIAKQVQASQKKTSDIGKIWADVTAKGKSFGKVGDDEAHAIATLLSGNKALSHVFLQGYLAGKFVEPQAMAAIAKYLQADATFGDPRTLNLALLGMGMGQIAKVQAGGAKRAPTHKKHRAHQAHAKTPARAHVAQGEFTVAHERLDAFVAQLLPRYNLQPRTFVGMLVGAPQPDPLIIAIQTLLNQLWGFVSGSLGYIRPTGIMTPHTKELLASFQQNYNVAPGDGTPNVESARALEGAVAEKMQLVEHFSPHTHTSGDFYVGGLEDDFKKAWGWGERIYAEDPLAFDPVSSDSVWNNPLTRWKMLVNAPGIYNRVTTRGEEPDWSALARGCPQGTWWDSLRGQCRPIQPHAVEGAHEFHFYTPRSEGAMVDLMMRLQDEARIPMTGDMPKWTARAYGALFQILWDGPDESVRVAVLDHDRGTDLASVWRRIDAVMAR